MKSREQFFEEQNIGESIEQRLDKARQEAGSAEIITEIPVGQLTEEAVWASLREFLPVHFKSSSGEAKDLPKDVFANRKFILRNKNGQELDFRKLAGKNTYFVRDRYNQISEEDVEFAGLALYKKYTNAKSKKPFFRRAGTVFLYGDLSLPGNILGLLHEIGHTKIDKKLSESYEKMQQKIDKAFFEGLLLKRKKPKADEILYHPRGETPTREVIIPKDLYLEMVQTEARVEHDAWAYALRVLHQHRLEGFDLEPSFKKLEDIKAFLASDEALGNYQEELEEYIKDKIGLYVRKPRTFQP